MNASAVLHRPEETATCACRVHLCLSVSLFLCTRKPNASRGSDGQTEAATGICRGCDCLKGCSDSLYFLPMNIITGRAENCIRRKQHVAKQRLSKPN